MVSGISVLRGITLCDPLGPSVAVQFSIMIAHQTDMTFTNMTSPHDKTPSSFFDCLLNKIAT
jgi:hypothetical protein